MRIFLRILVFFQLLLSAAALFFGTVLYRQREQLKARTDMLEGFMQRVSNEVERERERKLEARDLAKVDIPRTELKKYYKLDVMGNPIVVTNMETGLEEFLVRGEGTMHFTLEDFVRRVQKQRGTLDLTREKLTSTREKLEVTQQELRETAAKLAASQVQVAELNDKILDLDQEVAELKVTIDEKDRVIAERDATIVQKDEEIAVHLDRIAQLEVMIRDQKRYIGELQHKIKVLEDRLGAEAVVVNSQGPKGKIHSVNPNYNFVIIDIDEGCDVQRDLELIVKRKEKFIGKVKVTMVRDEENRAVAEILKLWLQMPIQKGDVVVYEIL